ncbi:MAG: circadian clock protein KaiB [Chthoniobacteraceae bacterium]|nr:circadian clock protein KaiB [Chthoniobacteraceae bacterium]
MKRGSKKPAKVSRAASSFEWDLRLYVAGPTLKSLAALRNLEQICEQHLAGHYQIKVIDLMKNPHLAQGDQIVAVPTLVRKTPSPVRRIIGNLADIGRVLESLDLQPHNFNGQY